VDELDQAERALLAALDAVRAARERIVDDQIYASYLASRPDTPAVVPDYPPDEWTKGHDHE
jgi:hypothetical protein